MVGAMTDYTDRNFAQNLRRLRERAGMKQSDLVDALRGNGLDDWHATTVSRTESGTRPARLSEARVIAKTLGVSVEEMMGGYSEAVQALDRADDLMARVNGQRNSFHNTRRHYIDLWDKARAELDSVNAEDGGPEVAARLERSRRTLGFIQPEPGDREHDKMLRMMDRARGGHDAEA